MSDAARSFIDKQLAREAAYRLLPTFAGGPDQSWIPAWVALLGELDESIFERSDPRVAQTKLAWWGKDLAAGDNAQHPLSRQLLRAPVAAQVEIAAWQRPVQEALRLAQFDAAPRDWPEADQRWLPMAAEVAAIESVLAGCRVSTGVVALQWQRQRLWYSLLLGQPAQGMAPLAWQADASAGDDAATRWQAFVDSHRDALAEERTARLPLHRSMLRGLWQWRLARLLRGRDPASLLAPAGLPLLWSSWRSARRAARY
jgi:hypothetical protein